MAVDLRQVLSAFLTLSLFGMLSNMVKHDYFDSSETTFQAVSAVQIGVIRVEEQATNGLQDGPWKEIGPELKPCWTKPSPLVEEPKGYVTFSLSMGPGYHELQIANAVAVARFLGATLVLPDIRQKEPELSRRFGDVYDVEKFINGMEGVVHVASDLPAQVAAEAPPTVRIPDGASEAYMAAHVAPVFQRARHVRVVVLFAGSNFVAKSTPSKDLDSLVCLTSHNALELTPEFRRTAADVIDGLRDGSRSTDGRFVAIDLGVDSSGSTVISALTEAGFDRGTTVYLTQSRWNESVDSIKENFPRTYTKEDLIDPEMKKQLFDQGEELEKAIDLYICTQSDAFLPAGDVIFASAIAGKRFAAGRNHILSDVGSHVARRCHC